MPAGAVQGALASDQKLITLPGPPLNQMKGGAEKLITESTDWTKDRIYSRPEIARVETLQARTLVQFATALLSSPKGSLQTRGYGRSKLNRC